MNPAVVLRTPPSCSKRLWFSRAELVLVLNSQFSHLWWWCLLSLCLLRIMDRSASNWHSSQGFFCLCFFILCMSISLPWIPMKSHSPQETLGISFALRFPPFTGVLGGGVKVISSDTLLGGGVSWTLSSSSVSSLLDLFSRVSLSSSLVLSPDLASSSGLASLTLKLAYELLSHQRLKCVHVCCLAWLGLQLLSASVDLKISVPKWKLCLTKNLLLLRIISQIKLSWLLVQGLLRLRC